MSSRTVDGLVTVNADDVYTIDLDVSGTATINSLEIDDIVVDTLDVAGATTLNTLKVSGLAELDGGVTTTTLTATTANITNLNLVSPLSPAQGGTGQTNLAAVTVGKASDVDGGQTGQVLVQVNVGDTGYVGSSDVGSVLTCNGALVIPSFQYPSVSNVTGVLPVLNGGTGVTTATGTGSVVRATNATLVAPVCNFITATSTENATSTFTGAVLAPSGGVSCGKNMFAGQQVIAQSTEESTNTDTGGIQTLGGVAAKKNIYAGGKVIALSTEDAINSDTGSIQTLGGIATKKKIYANIDIEANQSIISRFGYGLRTNTGDPSYKEVMSGLASNTILTINPGPAYPNVTIRNLTQINTFSFGYSRGTFLPAIKSLKDIGGTLTLSDYNLPTVNFRTGFYERIGSTVNISIATSITINGNFNSFTDANRYTVITGLPFRIGTPLVTSPTCQFNSICSEVSMPNGRAGSIPAPSVNTFNDPYQLIGYPNGYSLTPTFPPDYNQTQSITLDGFTLAVKCSMVNYFPTLEFPPYAELYTGWGYVNNVHILEVTDPYTLTFYANFTYNTDQ